VAGGNSLSIGGVTSPPDMGTAAPGCANAGTASTTANKNNFLSANAGFMKKSLWRVKSPLEIFLQWRAGFCR
jgi:hypothetical protein